MGSCEGHARPDRPCTLLALMQVAIVTGGNAGIGFETTRWLLRKNAKVYLACRSEQRANAAIAQFQEERLPGEVIYINLDLASLASIKKCATSFLAKEQCLDLLFNNGGILSKDVRRSSHLDPRHNGRRVRGPDRNECAWASLPHAAADSGTEGCLQSHA